MKMKKTNVEFYIEETVCDCDGELELIKEKSKGFWRDITLYKYKCKCCGKEYQDSDFMGFGKKIGKSLIFEYNGEKYFQGRLK